MRPPRPRKIGDGTFAAVVRAYLNSPKFAELRPSSQRVYRLYLQIAQDPLHLGLYRVEDLRPALVQDFLDIFSERPYTQKLARAALKAVEKWAVVRDLVPRAFTFGTETRRTDGGHVPWEERQYQLAREHSDPAFARVITLQGNTGQRGSDIVKMRWSDLEYVDGRLGINVKQQKTGRELWVPFTREFEREIMTWERRPGFILVREDGRPFTQRALAYRFERLRQEHPELSGLVMHGLRGYAVVRYSLEGLSESQISNLVGMSVPMVSRYRRKFLQKQAALAAINHLDGKNETGTRTNGGVVVTFAKPK